MTDEVLKLNSSDVFVIDEPRKQRAGFEIAVLERGDHGCIRSLPAISVQCRAIRTDQRIRSNANGLKESHNDEIRHARNRRRGRSLSSVAEGEKVRCTAAGVLQSGPCSTPSRRHGSAAHGGERSSARSRTASLECGGHAAAFCHPEQSEGSQSTTEGIRINPVRRSFPFDKLRMAKRLPAGRRLSLPGESLTVREGWRRVRDVFSLDGAPEDPIEDLVVGRIGSGQVETR